MSDDQSATSPRHQTTGVTFKHEHRPREMVTSGTPTIALQTARAGSTTGATQKAPTAVLVYGPFEVDEDEQRVYCYGRPVHVQRQVLATIAHLMRRVGRLVTRQELIAGPWNGVRVSAAAIDRNILRARRVLALAGVPDPIETVRGSGFRFTGSVIQLVPPIRQAQASTGGSRTW